MTPHHPSPSQEVAALCLKALEQSAEAFVIVDLDGRVVFSNDRFEAITQYSPGELRGRLLAEFPALASLPELVRTVLRQKPDNESWEIEFRSQRKTSLEPYWGHIWISRVCDANGQTTHLFGLCEDVTLKKLNYQRQSQQSLRDSLTGLGNRPYFIGHLERRLSETPDTPFNVLLMDIDNFKRINETLGHETGDKVLTSLSRRLRNALGTKACLARFASNEFAVLLEEQQDAEEVARQLLQLLSRPLFVANQLINVTASIGLVRYPEHSRNPTSLMHYAGLALHRAKVLGKNRRHVFTPELDAEAHRRQFIEKNLRHAIERKELLLYYQPKLCLKSNRLTGLEALLRWQHSTEGMFPPDDFIGLAEETGLIVPIGKWVFREACRMLHRLDEAGLHHVRIAINLSPRQFHDSELVSALREIVEQERVEASRLELELTESLLLDASQASHQQLHELKALGFTLAMDDFGTGYSSLSYLKKFPLDTIKIDRSFVKDIPANQDDMEITAAVIAMAHKLRLRVVAEGIETQEQLNFLRGQRCDIGQGFLFDRPIDSRELLQRLSGYAANGE